MERRKKIIQYVVALLAAMAAVLGGSSTGSAAAAMDVQDGDLREQGAEIFTGLAFDTCVTPSLGSMNAWLESQYRAVAVYFGGRGRACKQQANLTPYWMQEVHRTGWRVLPVYVGSQSPCVYGSNKKYVPIEGDPWTQGEEEGHDAVERAAELGMRGRSALYLDMEAYDHRDTDCAETTLSFVRGWSHEVRRHGYFAGFYSSATSGVRHVENARRNGVRDLPDVLWFARWDVPPSLYGEPVLDRAAWKPHRRIHQFAGNVVEEHGGVTMNIDRDQVDAPVAVVDQEAAPDQNESLGQDESDDWNETDGQYGSPGQDEFLDQEEAFHQGEFLGRHGPLGPSGSLGREILVRVDGITREAFRRHAALG
jgi:hypothetical protein